MSNTSIIHMRRQDQFGQPESKGGATIAFRVVDGHFVEIGVSICSVKDNFNRKLGIQLATKNLDARAGNHYAKLDAKSFVEPMVLEATQKFTAAISSPLFDSDKSLDIKHVIQTSAYNAMMEGFADLENDVRRTFVEQLVKNFFYNNMVGAIVPSYIK